VILVDELSHYPVQAAHKGLPSEWWCHMISDLCGEQGERELIAFASRLGLSARWIQRRGTEWVHFDLTPAGRATAVQAGATEVTSRELVARISVKRGRTGPRQTG
jgi:Protein of unknown function (DUF4031)